MVEPNRPPQLRHFQYIIVGLIDDLDPEQMGRLMARVLEPFYRRGALVSTYSPYLIIGSFGTFEGADDSGEHRIAAVAELQREAGTLIRIAHGQANGIVGTIGSKLRFSYQPLIPGFEEIQARLSETPFGTAFEVPEEH